MKAPELLLEVEFELSDDLPLAERNALLERFLREAITDAGAQFGGGGQTRWHGIIEWRAGGSIYGKHRHAVSRWLRSNADVLGHSRVSKLFHGQSDATPFECRRRYRGRVLAKARRRNRRAPKPLHPAAPPN